MKLYPMDFRSTQCAGARQPNGPCFKIGLCIDSTLDKLKKVAVTFFKAIFFSFFPSAKSSQSLGERTHLHEPPVENDRLDENAEEGEEINFREVQIVNVPPSPSITERIDDLQRSQARNEQATAELDAARQRLEETRNLTALLLRLRTPEGSNDIAVVRPLVERNPRLLVYAGLEVTRELVGENGALLEFASEEARSDIETVRMAIANNPEAVRFANPEIVASLS